MADIPNVSVCIATRNRIGELFRCLESLRVLTGRLRLEVVVGDDASEEPLAEAIRPTLGERYPHSIRFFRTEVNRGYIVMRNRLAELASGKFLLSLDDDAFLTEEHGVLAAVRLLEETPTAGAVAFAQLRSLGNPYPNFMQPAPVSYACWVPTYYGYAHLLRRDSFLSCGGYRTSFQHFGEEPEFCKRLLDRGYGVVYLPEAFVIHEYSPTNRSELKRLRHSIRNRCLDAIYNEPFPLCFVSIPAHIFGYLKWRPVACRYHKFSDEGGPLWLSRELVRLLPVVLAERKPLSWHTYRQWRSLQMRPRAFHNDGGL
jgi:GT2 family glycosyltransferase